MSSAFAGYRPAVLKQMPGIIPFRFPGVSGVECYFTTGVYGNISLDAGLAGEEDKHRRMVLSELLGFAAWTEMRQIHSDILKVNPDATPFDASSAFEGDGCCTDRPGQAMLSKAADCQQILFAHVSGKYVAALHVGWKGNAVNFPASGLRNFCAAYGIRPEDVLAVRGPSLGPKAAEFINFEQEWPAEAAKWFDRSNRCMDLWRMTKEQLIEAGLKPENIFGLDLCTYSLPELLFSFRRGSIGRQGALIFIKVQG